MRCEKCEKLYEKSMLFYDKRNLELRCEDCLGKRKGIEADEINEYLTEHHPEIERLQNKAVSTRLSLSQIMYLMKFAQEEKTGTISKTLGAMIDKLQEKHSLDHVELMGTAIQHGKKEIPAFLDKKVKPPKSLNVKKPEPEPEDEPEPEETEEKEEKDKDSEEVFEL